MVGIRSRHCVSFAPLTIASNRIDSSMAKSAPIGSDFHEDKIESRPSEPISNQQKITQAGQADSSEPVNDSAAQPLETTKGRKAGKKR